MYSPLFLLFLVALQACGTQVDPPDPEPEPYFKAGEYGGEELPGTEHLTWIAPSPDGQTVAVVRKNTPGELDPLYQLWLVKPDGSDPILLSYNVGSVFWHPVKKNVLAFNFNPHTTPYLYTFGYFHCRIHIDLLLK